MERRIKVLLLILALITSGVVSASANTITGTGYVVTNDTISVIVPTTLDFTIDPLEVGGRGSVYSEQYPLINLGDTDVILTFTSIDVIFSNETDFISSSLPINDSYSGGRKEAYLVLDFGNSEAAPIVLTDSYRWEIPSVTLNASYKQDSEYSLSISGSVNAHPDIEWHSGDIQISITYQLEAITEIENNMRSSEGTLIELPQGEIPIIDEPIITENDNDITDIADIADGDKDEEQIETSEKKEEQFDEQESSDTGEYIEPEPEPGSSN